MSHVRHLRANLSRIQFGESVDLLDTVPELPEGDLDLDPDELVKTSVVDDWTVFRVGDFETLNEMIKNFQILNPKSVLDQTRFKEMQRTSQMP